MKGNKKNLLQTNCDQNNSGLGTVKEEDEESNIGMLKSASSQPKSLYENPNHRMVDEILTFLGNNEKLNFSKKILKKSTEEILTDDIVDNYLHGNESEEDFEDQSSTEELIK